MKNKLFCANQQSIFRWTGKADGKNVEPFKRGNGKKPVWVWCGAKPNVKSIKEYHSYFVDIHHPSSLGHILIAEKIMEGVFLEFPSHRKYKVDECGNIEFVKGNQVVFIKTSPDQCANSKNENIVWLKKFMAAQPISYPYNMFKLRAEASLNQVGKNSRLLNNSEF